MVDPAERYNRLVAEEHERRRRLTKDAEAQMPTYGIRYEKLTPEQQHRDYIETKNTPGGFEERLDEWSLKFGLKCAVNDLLDWGIEQENRG